MRVNHSSHSGVFNLPQCPAFLSITMMRPQGLTTRQVSGRRPFQFQPHAQATRWRKRRRKNRFQKEGRSWSPRACERLWGRSAASGRRCPSPTIPPPSLTPARRGRSGLFRSPHRARACRRERPSARESASRGKREGRWWKEDWSKDRLMRARNSGVSRGVSSRDTSASSSRH